MRYTINKSAVQEIYGRNLFAINFINVNDIRDKNILDIGCGLGWFENYAVRSNCKNIYGMEISKKYLEIARNKIRNEKIKWVIGDAINLPFENETFDTVVSWEVLEHIPRGTESQYFKEVYRILKKNGIMYLSTPNNNFIAKILDPAWIFLKHRHYNVNDLSKIILENGFKIKITEIRGGPAELLGGINSLFAKWVFKRNMFFEKNFKNWQDKEFEKHGFAGIFMKLEK